MVCEKKKKLQKTFLPCLFKKIELRIVQGIEIVQIPTMPNPGLHRLLSSQKVLVDLLTDWQKMFFSTKEFSELRLFQKEFVRVMQYWKHTVEVNHSAHVHSVVIPLNAILIGIASC